MVPSMARSLSTIGVILLLTLQLISGVLESAMAQATCAVVPPVLLDFQSNGESEGLNVGGGPGIGHYSNLGVYLAPGHTYEARIIAADYASPPLPLLSGSLALAFVPIVIDSVAESNGWIIDFNATQSQISMRVMLRAPFVPLPTSFVARLQAFDGLQGTGTQLDERTVTIASSANDFGCLEVIDSANRIKSVRLEITAPAWPDGQEHDIIEIIDNLRFNTAQALCDTMPPNVTLLTPVNGATVYSVSTTIEASILETTSLVRWTVRARLLPIGAEQLLFDFFSPAPLDGTSDQYYFNINLNLADPPGETGDYLVTVRAEDAGCGSPNVREATALIHVIALPNSLNLYALGLDITQVTQRSVLPNAATDPGGPFSPPAREGSGWQYSFDTSEEVVHLISKKDTVVRVYPALDGVDSAFVLQGVRATLSGRDQATGDSLPGSPLVLDQPDETRSAMRPPIPPMLDKEWGLRDFLRPDGNRSFNFLLPQEWVTGRAIRLVARVEMPLGATECCDDFANESHVTDVTFAPSIDMNDKYQFILTVGTNAATRFWNVMDQVEMLYPVDEVSPETIDLLPTLIGFTFIESGLPCEVVDQMDSFIDQNRNAVILEDSGWQCGTSQNFSGITNGDSDMAIAASTVRTVPHEMGHLVGLNHAGVCHGEILGGSVDSYLFAHGSLGYAGLDTRQNPVVAIDPGIRESQARGEHSCDETYPQHAHDLMSYGGGTGWISPQTYNRIGSGLFSQLPRRLWAANATLYAAKAEVLNYEARSQATDYVSISGQVDVSTGRLGPIFRWSKRLDVSADSSHGDFSIVFRDAAKNKLGEHRFDVAPSSAHGETLRFFNRVLPFPTSATIIEFYRRGRLLDSRIASKHIPKVSFLTPKTKDEWRRSERYAIAWAATDGDRDRLTSILQFSTDGGTTWRTITPLVRSPILVNADWIPGSSKARLRVLVSDGFHTTVATSGIFNVTNKPPTVKITRPAGTPPDAADRRSRHFGVPVFRQGRPLAFRGRAWDVDDPIPHDSCWWTSSLHKGVLARGKKLVLRNLRPGRHAIVFQCRDAIGNVSADKIAIYVLPKSQPVPNSIPRPWRVSDLNACHQKRGFDPIWSGHFNPVEPRRVGSCAYPELKIGLLLSDQAGMFSRQIRTGHRDRIRRQGLGIGRIPGSVTVAGIVRGPPRDVRALELPSAGAILLRVKRACASAEQKLSEIQTHKGLVEQE